MDNSLFQIFLQLIWCRLSSDFGFFYSKVATLFLFPNHSLLQQVPLLPNVLHFLRYILTHELKTTGLFCCVLFLKMYEKLFLA